MLASGEKELPVEVSVEVEDNPRGWRARIDAAGLRGIVLNLTLNALAFTPSGTIVVRLAPDPSRRGMGLTVADTGIGMTEAFVRDRRLFQPFCKASPFSAGAGLGLPICEALVERMRGELSIESVLDRGTTAHVVLPFEASHSATSSPSLGKGSPLRRVLSGPVIASPSSSETTERPDATPWDEQPLRVLVADDNFTARRILTQLLKRKGVDYREAQDGLQALELYRIWRPHVLWTDVRACAQSIKLTASDQHARHGRPAGRRADPRLRGDTPPAPVPHHRRLRLARARRPVPLVGQPRRLPRQGSQRAAEFVGERRCDAGASSGITSTATRWRRCRRASMRCAALLPARPFVALFDQFFRSIVHQAATFLYTLRDAWASERINARRSSDSSRIALSPLTAAALVQCCLQCDGGPATCRARTLGSHSSTSLASRPGCAGALCAPSVTCARVPNWRPRAALRDRAEPRIAPMHSAC